MLQKARRRRALLSVVGVNLNQESLPTLASTQIGSTYVLRFEPQPPELRPLH